MKVVDDRIKPRILPLVEILPGKVFRYNNHYYIKAKVTDGCMDSRECVDVRNGQIVAYNKDINVEELEVELHIIDRTDKEEEVDD